MLPIKLSNSNSNFLTFLFVILFFFSSSFGEEKSVDIWNKKNDTKSEENKKNDNTEEESKIDISKINQKKKDQIHKGKNGFFYLQIVLLITEMVLMLTNYSQ